MEQLTTHLENGYTVSTIKRTEELRQLDELIEMISPSELLGRADLSTPGDYETMVFRTVDFKSSLGMEEYDFARYDSEQDAKRGHEHMKKKWIDHPDAV